MLKLVSDAHELNGGGCGGNVRIAIGGICGGGGGRRKVVVVGVLVGSRVDLKEEGGERKTRLEQGLCREH